MLRAAAAERNKGPILNVLQNYLRDGMKVLEISSGTGQHCAYFAENLPGITWQPSEFDPRSIHSIVAHVDSMKDEFNNLRHSEKIKNHILVGGGCCSAELFRLPNIHIPLFIDVSKTVDRWALPQEYGPHEVDVLLNINMIHISSNDAVEGLFRAAGGLLKYETGMLITYGPYSIDKTISPQSNIDFDASLRAQNSEWGLRDVDDLNSIANKYHLRLAARHDMPANNYMLIFSKD